MSFSDFGRTAMAALTPAAAVPSPTAVTKSRNARRSSDPIPPRMALDGRRRSGQETRVPKPSRLESSRRRRSDGGAIADHRRNSTKSLEIERGVRPKLDHIQCPVTKKTLMDDVLTVQSGEVCNDASLASTSISSSTTSEETSYDDDSADDFSESDIGLNQTSNRRTEGSRRKHRSSTSLRSSSYIDARKSRREAEGSSHSRKSPKRRPRRLPKHYNNISEPTADDRIAYKHSHKRRDSKAKVSDKKESRNSSRRQNQSSGAGKLSTEIAQFQKMVADLEALSGSSASSPEAMWKSRILLRSAEDAEKDLKVSLEKDNMDVAAGKSTAAAALAASRKKMHRDYQRASEQLRLIVVETERRQKAEISTLTATEAAQAGGNPVDSQKRALMGAAEAEEDFFERAMRERQEEVQKISDGMKKVQDIYTDLAGLVDGQQEQIDKLEELNEEVKADTRAGLEEIQHGMWKLCMAEQHKNDGVGTKSPTNGAANRNTKKKILDPSDIFNCMMACHGNPEMQGGARGILSLEEDLYHERSATSASAPQHLKHSNADYYRDDVEVAESGWNLPNLEDVQESAQDAYQKGHAIVEGLVGQVQEVVASGDLRDVGNRISCTAQPEEAFLGENSGIFDGVELEDDETSAVKHSQEEIFDHEPYRHRSEDRHRHKHSRSRRSSHSHSKQKHKHESRHRQHEPDEWEEAQIRADRIRRNGRHRSSR